MSKTTWADVKKHDVVELGGKAWTVVKIKPSGKAAKVTVSLKGREAKSVVRLKDRVVIPSKGGGSLADERGAQRRWATKKELATVMEAKPAGLPAGDPTITKPPAKPGAAAWSKPEGKAEKVIANLLEARLVAESKDERAGFYVPPVSISTVAAHMALFHGGIPDSCDDVEARMVAAHDAQHAAAKTGAALAVNHWHTATRPIGS